MKSRRFLSVSAGIAVLAALTVAGTLLPHRAVKSDPWARYSYRDKLYDLLPAQAQAVPTPSPCPAGIARIENVVTTYVAPAGTVCNWFERPVNSPATQSTFCGGGTSLSVSPFGAKCYIYPLCGDNQFGEPLLWQDNADGSCDLTFDPGELGVTCESACDIPEPCCPSGDCPSCPAKPVSAPRAELAYELPVFDLADGMGLPARFSVHWAQKDHTRRGFPTNPLGYHASHTFSLFFTKVKDGSGQSVARVSIEDGATESFLWNGSAWVAQAGAKSTLAAGNPTTCLSEAVLTRAGTVYRFSDFCTGAASEGQPRRVERPDGGLLVFTTSSEGQLTEVRNARGAKVEFEYGPTPGAANWGLLYAVKSPRGDRFTFQHERGRLKTIRDPSGAPLWSLTVQDTGSLSGALLRVDDARGKREQEWSWVLGPDNQPLLDWEEGPGPSADTRITFGDGAGDSATLTFKPAGSSTNVTNTYAWSDPAGGRPRVNARIVNGTCPNCGKARMDRTFWPSSLNVRAVRDANGFGVLYEDLSDLGDETSAYDSNANVLTQNVGCTFSSWPTINPGTDCPTSGASAVRTTRFTYFAGTGVVDTVTRPSVSGGTVTNDRTFDGTSTRVNLDMTQGKTAADLDGLVDDLKRRVVDYDYGVVGSAHEITVSKGPYWEDVGFTAADPRTEYEYYEATDNDLCGTSAMTTNTGRLKRVKRFVDATRALVTEMCEHDGAGRVQKMRGPDGTITKLTYNWRGQIEQTIVDFGGLNLTTDSVFDANGNLVELKLPRIEGGDRSGWKYVLDDADRITNVQHGFFNMSTGAFTLLEEMRNEFDHWGNRTKTEYKDAAGVVIVSEGAKYDNFNRLICIAQPWAADCSAAASKTTFDYDPEGNLKMVSDAQGDDLMYGSLASDLQAYNRFGKIERTRQEVCDHPASDPNGACASPSWADVDFAYDAALQLQQVTVQGMVTSYTNDDFGNVVKIVSPDSGASYFRYDAGGRLVGSFDARQVTHEFIYDRLGRITAKIANSSTIYCYDGYNAACGGTNGAGRAGFLTAVSDQAGFVEFTHDAAGRLTQERRVMLGAEFTTSYVYDADGNVTEVKHPNGLRFLKTFDMAGRETSVTWKVGSYVSAEPIVDLATWHPFGGLASWRVPGPNPDWTFSLSQDQAGRITESALDEGAVTLESITYGYANDGNVLRIPSTEEPPNILHDSLSRLIQDRGVQKGTTSPIIPLSYKLDDAGNRQTLGVGSYAEDLTYAEGTDRLESVNSRPYSVDAAGNHDYLMLEDDYEVTITYADSGHASGLITAYPGGGGQTAFTRDYRNQRVDHAGPSGGGTFFYAPSGELTQWVGQADTIPCGGTNTYLHFVAETYLYLGGRRITAIETVTWTECGSTEFTNFTLFDVRYYFSDKMDLARAVYSRSGENKIWAADFDAFGNPLWIDDDPDGDATHYSQPFRLPGQFALTEEEGGPMLIDKGHWRGGLHENWNRLYDSTIGRYLQPDPLGQAADVSLYRYTANRPLAYVDRDGQLEGVQPQLRTGLDPKEGLDRGPWRFPDPCRDPYTGEQIFGKGGCDKPQPQCFKCPSGLEDAPFAATIGCCPQDDPPKCEDPKPDCWTEFDNCLIDCLDAPSFDECRRECIRKLMKCQGKYGPQPEPPGWPK